MKRSTRQPPLFFNSDWQPHARIDMMSAQMIELESEEAAHAIKSLRLGIGDLVHITNGRGMMGIGHINAVGSRPPRIGVEVTEINADPLPPRKLKLASALPKGERQGTLLDIATQLGISDFIPLECDYSAVQFRHSMISRWQRIAKSACKQSRRLTVPAVASSMTLKQLIAGKHDQDLFLLGEQNGKSISQIAKGIMHPFRAIVVIVGPEGGFSAAERQVLRIEPQIHPISAGPHILRTEAAGVTLLGLANQLIANQSVANKLSDGGRQPAEPNSH